MCLQAAMANTPEVNAIVDMVKGARAAANAIIGLQPQGHAHVFAHAMLRLQGGHVGTQEGGTAQLDQELVHLHLDISVQVMHILLKCQVARFHHLQGNIPKRGSNRMA